MPQNTCFLEYLCNWRAKNTYFLVILGFRSVRGAFWAFYASRIQKTCIFSYMFAVGLQKTRIFSYFWAVTLELLLLIGSLFGTLLVSFWRSKSTWIFSVLSIAFLVGFILIFVCFWGHFDTIKVAQVRHLVFSIGNVPHLMLMPSGWTLCLTSFWYYQKAPMETIAGSDCGHSGRRCSLWERALAPGHRHRDRWRQQRQQQLSPAPNRWAFAKRDANGSAAPGKRRVWGLRLARKVGTRGGFSARRRARGVEPTPLKPNR